MPQSFDSYGTHRLQVSWDARGVSEVPGERHDNRPKQWDPPTVAGVVALADRQHGVVGVWQLLAMGVSRPRIKYRVATGLLFRIHRGVYAVGRRTLTRGAIGWRRCSPAAQTPSSATAAPRRSTSSGTPTSEKPTSPCPGTGARTAPRSASIPAPSTPRTSPSSTASRSLRITYKRLQEEPDAVLADILALARLAA